MINLRNRKLWLSLALLATIAFAAFRVVARRAEEWIGLKIDETAARTGLRVHADTIHVGLFPPVRLSGVTVEKVGQWAAQIDTLSFRPRIGGSQGVKTSGRVTLGETRITLPAGFELQSHRTVWDVERNESMTLRAPVEGLVMTMRPFAKGKAIDLRATALDIDRVGSLVLEGDATHDVGVVDGEAHIEGESREDFQARWNFRALGATTTGTVYSKPGATEPRIGFTFALEHIDFARLFNALSVDVETTTDALGALSGTMSAEGVLSDPDTLQIKQDFKFEPPKVRPPEVAKLRGAFTHQVITNQGAKKVIVVSPDAPNFVPIGDVPAAFIRALLIAEDSAFFSHPGVDFTELPKVIAINIAKGESARGGSTITQQLAKNLFLTREKSLHRKLKELAFTFLLESTLSKPRILEIYLNVIEWGPGLYGLRPAAGHYFGKEPWDLTPKEIAFLVTLIPGPIKYQGSFANGELRRGFETLVNNLLVKMRSIDVITEEQYQEALLETLAFGGEAPPGEGSLEPPPDPTPTPIPKVQ